MKRPLLWAIVWFALGEVLAINISNEQQAGVLIGALACCVLGRKRSWFRKRPCLKVWLLSAFLGVLIAHIHYEDFEYGGMEISQCGNVKGVDEKKGEEGTAYNLIVEINDKTNNDRYKVLIYGCEELYKLGSCVRVSGRLEIFETARNPGAFDMQKYYLSRGIVYCMYTPEIISVSEEYSRLQQTLWEIRAEGCKRLDIMVEESVAGLFKGILLGEKDDIDIRTKLAFQITSLMHILSLSGLHLSLISAVVYRLLKSVIGTVYIASPVTMGILYVYGLMTGFSVATIRAFIMLLIAMLGDVIGRDYDILTADGITLFLLLFINPYRIYDAGMWLSVSAIAGVFAGRQGYRRLACRLHLKTGRIRKYIIESFLLSVFVAMGINIVTLPITLLQYYQFCPYSLLLNLIVIPLMSVVVMSGMIALITVSHITGTTLILARYIIKAGEWILKLYRALCAGTIKLPGYVINTGKPELIQVVIYYVAIFLIYELLIDNKVCVEYFNRLNKIIKQYIAVGVAAAAIMSIAVIGVLRDSERAVFLDVGQGDAIAIRTEKGTNICVDGGSSSKDEVGRYMLIPALKSMRMAHIDYWFISHTDEDHISGLIEILQLGRLSGLDIDNIVFATAIERDEKYIELCELAELNGVNIVHMNYMDRLEGKDFKVICYHPIENGRCGTESIGQTGIYDKNQASLALLYQSDKMQIMLLGDMDTTAIEDMLNETDIAEAFNTQSSGCKILKVPHHGSRYSACDKLYEGISFDVAVISCGKNNLYGHPHEEVLEILEENGMNVLRTDEAGAIVMK